MKYIKFFLVGILFGIVMSKAEIISWYRIYEMFKFSTKTRLMINKDTDIHDLRRAAIKDGLQPLRLSGANKVAKGETTVAEVLRVAPPPLES